MDQFLRSVFGHIVLYLGLLGLGLILAAATVLILPLLWLFTSVKRRKTLTRQLVRSIFDAYLRGLGACGVIQVDLDQLDRLANEERLIVAVNHPSLLDAMLIVSRLPNASCIMKYSLMQNPLLGFGARMAGYIRNDSTQGLVRSAGADLAQGSQLVVFPEGTRTVELPINELRAAYATIARRAKVPIQLVMINSNSRFLGKGWPLWKRPQFPLRYQASLLERIDPASLTRAQIVELTDKYFRDAIGDSPFDLNNADSATEPRLNPSL